MVKLNINNMSKLKNTIKIFFLNLNSVEYFFTIFFSTITIIWTIIEIVSFFGIDFQYFKDIKYVSLYLIFTHGITIGFIALYLRERNQEKIDSKNEDSILAKDLIESLNNALKVKKYLEVIRIGSVLSRPLFISGYFKTRLQIGILVEEAAAATNDDYEQMVALIDSIGWSYLELGKLDIAEKNIKHGQEIAEKISNYFYLSKSYRHIGVIYRRKKDYQKAEINYKKSLSITNDIKNEKNKNESFGGINYALANLYFLKGDMKKGLKFIDNSINFFTKNNDHVRHNLALIKKADILFHLDKKTESKDLYRKALSNAESVTHRLHMIRCFLGLAKINIEDKNWNQAMDYIEKAKVIDNDIHSINESKEINDLINSIHPLGIV